MDAQLFLIVDEAVAADDDVSRGTGDWRLDDDHRRAGLLGLAAARQALREAHQRRARSSGRAA